MKPANILHLHSTFNLGGKEARAVRLMNHFGDSARHSILTAVDGALSARDAIDPKVEAKFPGDAPSLAGKPAPARYRRIANYMQQFDLVLSYNWGSMDGVMAHRLLQHSFNLPPLIHHEDGFNEDEAVRLNWKRNMFRRLGLLRAHALVVPSRTLEHIGSTIWHVGSERLHRISNGIDVSRYANPCKADAIAGFERRADEVVIGTLAGLRAVKNIPRLVRAVSVCKGKVRLVVVGDGPERGAIRAEAERCGIADRLVMPGFMQNPHLFMGLFDIFALSSDSEQYPISVVEAMAAGLPVMSTDVGDVRNILTEQNAELIVAPSDDDGYAQSLQRLITDAKLRKSLGAANKALAVRAYDERDMLQRYSALYGSAMGRPGFPDR